MKANSKSPPLIGIDFGTTKTMVAHFDPTRSQALPLRLGLRGYEIPTSIYQTPEGRVLFGEQADDEGVSDQINYIHRFKMKLGLPGPAQVGRKSGTAEQFAAEFLEHIRTTLKNEELHCNEDSELDYAVLTIPAIFGRAQQNDLKRAAETAGFKQVVLLAEPVAAGIAYCDHHAIQGSLRFLVVDWGGGTFDVALVERTGDGQIKIMPEFVDGLEDIGGECMDDLLFDATSRELTAAGVEELGRQARSSWGKHKREITRAKERLSTRDDVEMSFVLDDGTRAAVKFERATLEEALGNIITKGVQFAEGLLRKSQASGLAPDFVLLAGGTARIPMVKRVFEETLQIDCRTWNQGREAIALGAALKARDLWGETADASAASQRRTTSNPVSDSLTDDDVGGKHTAIEQQTSAIDDAPKGFEKTSPGSPAGSAPGIPPSSVDERPGQEQAKPHEVVSLTLSPGQPFDKPLEVSVPASTQQSDQSSARSSFSKEGKTIAPEQGNQRPSSASTNIAPGRPKTRKIFVILGVFLGFLGIHNFYAGYNMRGWFQLMITLISLFAFCWVSMIWAVIEIATVTKDVEGRDFI